MKTITKTTKAILVVLLAMILCVAMAFSLAACNNDNDDQDTPPADSITKYDATLDASITMGAAGPQQLGSNIVKGTYITVKDGKYTLTLIMEAGEMTVFGITKNVFIDDNPENPQTIEGIKDGTIGIYKADGTIVTEGVKLTYSSGDEYEYTPSGKEVYYVKSAEFPIDSVRESYDLTMFFNSPMMGKQFSNATYKATLKLDLQSGTAVESISGYGVATRGEIPLPKFTKYEAELSCFVTAMGGVEFGDGLLSGVYIEKDAEQYFMTLIFNKSQVTIFTVTCDTFVDTDLANKGTSKGVEDGTIGFYDKNGLLVTDGVEVGYSSGDDYATSSTGNVYYVKSVTMPIDELRETYKLTLYVNSSVMGMQFCEANATATGTTYSASLTLDLESGTEIDNIDNLIGVPVRGEAPKPNYNVTVSGFDVAEGSVTLSPQKDDYEAGTQVTLTVTPAEGHGIEKVTVGGNTVKLNAANAYTFEVNNTTAIEVEFHTEYEVPIESLTSGAPLPAVKAAFNEAFGKTATLIITKDGSMRLRLQNRHMVIDMASMGLGKFDANVAWIQDATVLSTKEEIFSNVNGNLTTTPTQESITVPDVFEIAYTSDSNGVLTLTIGVDFMAKMNNQGIEEYSTNVTLTLDVSSLNLEA